MKHWKKCDPGCTCGPIIISLNWFAVFIDGPFKDMITNLGEIDVPPRRLRMESTKGMAMWPKKWVQEYTLRSQDDFVAVYAAKQI